jgi:hypothetical protein
MAKKISSVQTAKTPAAAKPDLSRPVVSTEIRNSPIPKSSQSAAPKKEITYEMVAERAYYISQSGTGGSPDENWLRAEHELRGS